MNANHVTLTGTVVFDPELRYTAAGTAVCSFRIVHNTRKKVGDKWEDGDPLFIGVQTWRQLAENVASSYHKGDLVVVTGKLQARSWEKDGNTVNVIEVDAEDVAASAQWSVVTVERTERKSGPREARAAVEKAAPVAGYDPDEEPW